MYLKYTGHSNMSIKYTKKFVKYVKKYKKKDNPFLIHPFFKKLKPSGREPRPALRLLPSFSLAIRSGIVV